MSVVVITQDSVSLTDTDCSGVYLLHLERPLGTKSHAAQHYLGYAENINGRLRVHRAGMWKPADFPVVAVYNGHGSKMLGAANFFGIAYHLVRVWPGADQGFEALLKRRRHHTRLCPVCNPSWAACGRTAHSLEVLRGGNDADDY